MKTIFHLGVVIFLIAACGEGASSVTPVDTASADVMSTEPDNGTTESDVSEDTTSTEEDSLEPTADVVEPGEDSVEPVSDTGEPAPDAASPVSECTEDKLGKCVYVVPEYTTDSVESVLGKQSYGRDLPILVRFPTDAEGPRPVVVVSHGGTFSVDGHVKLMKPWGEALATAGYVVIHIAHTPFDMAGFAQLCTTLGIPGEECDSEGINPGWVLKPADASAVIDELPTIAALLLENKGVEVDVSKVASLGWSGGSQVATTLAGATRILSESVMNVGKDDRVLTAIVLSPQGPGYAGYFETEEWTSMDTVDIPLLVSTGDNDYKESNPGLFPEIRRETFDNLPEGGGHRLLYSTLPVGVGGHGTYQLGDQDSSDDALIRFSQALRSAVFAHLDQYLANSEEAAAYLESDHVLTLAGPDATEWSKK